MNTSLQCSEVQSGAGALAPARGSLDLSSRLVEIFMRDIRECDRAFDLLMRERLIGPAIAVEKAKEGPRFLISQMCSEWFEF